MKILTGRQIRQADEATIERAPISSLDLMERAAIGIARWIAENVDADSRLLFCCGKGGNGGDGLATARILALSGRECAVFLAAVPGELADDTRANLARLPRSVKVSDMTIERLDIKSDTVIIDALLGVGVAGEVREPVRGIIEWINSLSNRVISIDIPSGMATEWGSIYADPDAVKISNNASVSDSYSEVGDVDHPTVCAINDATLRGGRYPHFRGGCHLSFRGECRPVVRAETTLTIGFPKLAMLLPETGEYAGNMVVISVELDEEFLATTSTPYYYVTREWAESLLIKSRAKFSHKGDYGHALIVAGSATMPGAANLAVGGALRSGCGLVTAHISKNERFALAATHPSAMLSLDDGECFTSPPSPPSPPSSLSALDRFTAIGVGPGLGRDSKTVAALGELLAAVSSHGKTSPSSSLSSHLETPLATLIPLVLDADALNIIAENIDMQRLIPADSILTPHPGELRRLVGEWRTDKEKLEKASGLARETRSIVIVKGAHSVICTPDGRFLFNSTGTPGMAKGGSGDVLTGLITGLMARGYDAETASITGVYLHGRAGERAARRYGEEAMNASDLAKFLQPAKNSYLRPRGRRKTAPTDTKLT